jgi:hypothetical protein
MMKLTPYVNVDVKMPKQMQAALTVHEFYCIGRQIKAVTEQSVKQFLSDRYDLSMADKFKTEYLVNTQET